MKMRETYRTRQANVMYALELLLDRAHDYGLNTAPKGRHQAARWLSEAALKYAAAVRTLARGSR